MKISIFPTVLPLPKSKEEKHQQSKRASQCEVIEISTEDELASAVSSYAWSPFIFANNKRLSSNFIATDMLVYDVDDGMRIEQAEAIIAQAKLTALCLPSTSHTEEHHKFRIIMPLARTITNAGVYASTWSKGAELFGVVDEQTKDLGRFYFGCRQEECGFWLEGDFFAPVIPTEPPVTYSSTSQYMVNVSDDLQATVTQIYGEKRTKIPESVDFFIKNAHSGLPGKWINAINSAAFSLALSGVEEDVIVSVM